LQLKGKFYRIIANLQNSEKKMNFPFLKENLKQKLEQIKEADIIVGIPSYHNQDTIKNVIDQISNGLEQFYPDLKSMVIVSDGGSTDDTQEKAEKVNTGKIKKIITTYQGLPGKGSALRTVFAASCALKTKVGLCLDADLRSIKSDWVKKLANPILENKCDFIAPLYLRHKYDATITNDIAYPLTRALYGIRVRQPIGGDFAFSQKLASEYLEQDVWKSDVARFGIDIFMSTIAICHGYKIGQSPLGVKSHNPKDPITLIPMFRQVVGTMFDLSEKYHNRWQKIQGSVNPRITGKVEFFEPEKITFSLEKLKINFRKGWEKFSFLWEKMLEKPNFKYLNRVKEEKDLLYASSWAKIVYDYLLAYHKNNNKVEKSELLKSLVPIYQIRIASFIEETEAVNSEKAERIIENQALAFEDCKPYLVERWNKK